MSTTAAASSPTYRMRDLCALTGLSRQAIHFYIQQGLVPEGTKTGRNMAFYGPEHVERLRIVRQLQEERYLPLKQIRALLDGDGHIAESQRELSLEVRARLSAAARNDNGGRAAAIDVDARARDAGVDPADLDELIAQGLLAVRPGDDGVRLAAAESIWILDLWGQQRRLGYTRDLGFTVADLAPIHTAVTGLVDHETRMLQRLADLPASRLADMAERALPLVNAMVVQLHAAAVRSRLTTVDAPTGN